MIGKRLRQLRKSHSLTQKQLADYLDVSLNSVSQYERELCSPDDDTKVKIAKRFNVSLDYLLGATDRQIPIAHNQPLLLYLENLTPEALAEFRVFMEGFIIKYKLRG